MSQYSFKKTRDKENHFDNTDVEINFDGVSLEDMCEAFQDFLAGCGFQVQDKEVIIQDVE